MDNDDVPLEGSVTTPTRCKGRDLALKHVSIVSEDRQTGKFKAQCNYCPSILTGDKKSTSNLLVHMKKKHPAEVEAVAASRDSGTPEKSQSNQKRLDAFVMSASSKPWSADDPTKVDLN